MPFSSWWRRRRWPSWLPRGGSLPDAAWQARHRAVMVLLWGHVVAIPIYAVYKGNSLGHAWVETAPVLMAALLAGYVRMSRALQASIAAGGLMICSGVMVHLSEGLIEAHFHFFVMIPVIALYEAWAPFTLGVVYVLVHHGVMGTAAPREVYNHPAAWERPWLFAAVHAGFFACASIACVVNWWLHERARGAALAQTQLLGTIVDSLREGLVVLDPQGGIRLRNPAAVALMGGADNEARGLGPDDGFGLFHPDGTAVAVHELPHVQALAGDRTSDVDLVVRNAAVPEGRVLNFSAVPLPSPDGGGTREVVVVYRDVTEQHQTEQALTAALATEQEAVERLRELERVKSDFVSTVSHELRTPLTSIIGYLEVLEDGAVGDLGKAQVTLVDRVNRNSRRLLVLVEDLLTLSQIESSRLTINAVPTDLRDVVSTAFDAVAWTLENRSLEVVVDVPDDPVRQEVDPAELERMLVNLLTNAVKFTPDGGRIALRLAGDDLGSTLVVTDTGLGIPDAEQGQLFTRFFRSSIATERAVQGTGLGLTIVQAIVALHGGSIDVESSTDRGTTVTVRLPRRAHGADLAEAPVADREVSLAGS
ncbi:ATP-binding protein [Nocardioides sp. YIM 152315]|uniref:sensor histidine kinase n=1 Tax=Nocardioides sp. YIM 152315 TaxID=3031760 RepID=UPI0023DCCEC1|nr:ATP-binding protein [Nocardioides sp. YIM 152315]MDF1606001.1 ATP-binding protein [Nocardioides sp. YIM 152315]